jgi:O-antigen/teichoic acid export membrane protein
VDREPGKHRARDQWGPAEVIALVVIIGAFMLAAVGLAFDKPGASVPAWVVALVGGIGLYYYRTNGKGE